MKKLLLIDDDPQVFELARKIAKKMGLDITVPAEFSEGFMLLDSSQFDLVIVEAQPKTEISFPGTWIKDGEGGIDGKSYLPLFLNSILKARQIPKFIIIARGGFPAEGRFALKKGAIDYIQIPMQRAGDGAFAIDFKRFEERLEGCLRVAVAIVEKSRLEKLDLGGIVGTSAQIKNALSFLAYAVGNNFNVLIKGEIGTGKKLFARKIHDNSNRKDTGLVVVDCNSFQNPETNFKDLNDFFLGKGAGRPPIGTIVFNEISYLPMSLQGNLSELIQKNWKEREKSGAGPVYRIISTSSKDLNALLEHNQFREDLYFELNTIEFDLPPLRERRDDIPQIADFIIEKLRIGSTEDEKIGMSQDFVAALKGYSWPGNIKELKSALTIAFTNSAGMQIFSPTLLPHKVLSGSTTALFNESFQMDAITIEEVFDMMNQPGVLVNNDALNLKAENQSTSSTTQVRENLQICFHQSGNFWEIGNPEQPVTLATLNGYGFIYFLLQKPNQFFNPVEVFHMGKSDSETYSFETNIEVLSKSMSPIIYSSKNGRERRMKVESAIEEIEEQISSGTYTDPEEAMRLKDIINKYKKEKSRKFERDPHSPSERARINVSKAITRALNEIYKQIPEMKQYLNSSTIKTGDQMVYHPVVGNEPTWILFKK